MGFLNSIKNRLPMNSSVSIENGYFNYKRHSYAFSNCMIAGTKSSGRDALLRTLVSDALLNGKSIFVIQNGTSLPNNTVKNYFNVYNNNRDVFNIDFGGLGFTEPVNFFKGSSIDFVQELVLLLMDCYRNTTPEIKSFAERYLNEVLSLYKINPIKKFSLDSITDFDRNWFITEANRLYNANRIDIASRDRFLQYANDLTLYRREYNEYENFCIELKKQNFAKLLSGMVSYSHLNTDRFITFITLDYISCTKQSNAFLQLFIHKAISEMRMTNSRTTFVFEDVDTSQIPEFQELLKACISSGNNKCYFTCDSISSFQNANYDPRTYCNTFFVFRQTIMQEAEEWAKTTGTYKKDKATQTTSDYQQVYGRYNTGFLGTFLNVANRNRQVVTGVNHEIVDEYNVLPSVFMNLSNNTSETIIQTGYGTPFTLQVTWQ